MFDPHGTELSGERGASTAFSGEGEEHRVLLQIHHRDKISFEIK